MTTPLSSTAYHQEEKKLPPLSIQRAMNTRIPPPPPTSYVLEKETIEPEDIEHALKHKKIEKITLKANKLPEKALLKLATLERLQNLHIICPQVTDEVFSFLPSHIQHLYFENCTTLKLKPSSFETLKKVQNIAFNNCQSINASDLGKFVAELPSLSGIYLRNMPLSQKFFVKDLCTIKGLHKLVLDGCTEWSADDLYLAIRACPSLQDLTVIHSTAITDIFVAQLGLLDKLVKIHISSCSSFLSTGIALLADSKKLKILNLSGCLQIDDDAIESITDAETVQHLDVSKCPKLTDTAVADLIAMKSLQTLAISHTRFISQNALQLLKQKKLNHLIIIPRTPLEELQAQLDLKSKTAREHTSKSRGIKNGSFLPSLGAIQEDT